MIIRCYDCINGNYTSNSFDAKVSKRVLFHPAKGTLEVDFVTTPEVEAHSGGRFNLMLRDRDDSIDDDDRKYFAKISWWQKQQLIWAYGKNWFQSPDNLYKIGSFIVGYALGWIIGQHH